MFDSARFFAYSTWVIMISLAIILFSDRFLIYINETQWQGYGILAALGLIYFNLTYASVKRYIQKVPAPTNSHYLLGLFILMPPSIWIIMVSDHTEGYSVIILSIITITCIAGLYFGNLSGIKARFRYIQKLKEKKGNVN